MNNTGKMVTPVGARRAARMVVGGAHVCRYFKTWCARNDRRSFKQALKNDTWDDHQPRRVDPWRIA